MNTLEKTKTGTAIATPTRNPFTDYGNSGTSEHIYGTLLKYVKGDWVAGEHQEDIPLGTKMVAIMDKMALGWVRWENKKPTDQLLALVVSGGAPRRADCGDLDKSLWPLNDRNEQADPWQATSYLPLIDLATNKVYTFAASSKGGNGAGKKLSKDYGAAGAVKYPIIVLGTDSYIHEEYGKTKVPTLKIIGWVDKAKYDDLLIAGAAAAQGDADESENPGDGMDDEIHF